MRVRAVFGAIALAAAGLAAAVVPASAATSAPAKAAGLGPGWSQVWMLDDAGGNGCAIPQVPVLAPVISYPCESGNFWEERMLKGSYGQVGAEMELVNSAGTLAFGFSGGEFKMETPNASSTYIVEKTGVIEFEYAIWENPGDTNIMGPNGKGLPLKEFTFGQTAPAPPNAFGIFAAP